MKLNFGKYEIVSIEISMTSFSISQSAKLAWNSHDKRLILLFEFRKFLSQFESYLRDQYSFTIDLSDDFE